jgi:hypothetical protein
LRQPPRPFPPRSFGRRVGERKPAPGELILRGTLAEVQPPNACAGTGSVDVRVYAVVTVELRETEIDSLVQKGLLKTDARNDTRSVRAALYQYFDSTLN